MKNKFSTKLKTNLTAIILVLLMATVMIIAIPVQPVQAQTQLYGFTGTPDNLQEGGSIALPSSVTPDLRVKTTAYLSFRPNPVGVGQTIIVNLWLNPATHASRYLTGYKVTITKPDGTSETKTLKSYRADTTTWFEYVVDQEGTWKLKFEFPGGYYPAGNYTAEPGAVMGSGYFSFTKSCYYEPSQTTEQTLIVQHGQVLSWPPSPLPTDYWTRPVSPENREWYSILGDYPWNGPGGGSNWPADTNTYYASSYSFVPYVQAPNTAHVVWRQQGAISGLTGGIEGYQSYTNAAGTPTIIYQGRCYQTYTKPGAALSAKTYMECYDLRTGEKYWEYQVPSTTFMWFGIFEMTTAIAPSVIEYEQGYGEVPGAQPQFGRDVNLLYIGGGSMLKFNAYTGVMTSNISIAPLDSGTYYMNGYALSVQNTGDFINPSYRLINWSTGGTGTSFASRIVSNISWPLSSIGTVQDFNVGVVADVASLTPEAAGAWVGTSVVAVSLKTGQVLWNKTVEDTAYSAYMCSVADHGKVAVLMMGGYWDAWDLTTGDLAWKSEAMDYPWSQPAFGAYAVQSAYGLLYREAYDGVYAFDWDTGKIVWHYEAQTPYGYETTYIDKNGTSVYSFNAGGIIADGKLYTYNTEHTPEQPITRGWRLHCINAITGEGIWDITGAMTPGAVADGYLTAGNSYDGYMYVFGKGQSATTVSAPQTAITQGQSIVLTGTVLDQSPGQPNTPCVSKESMTQWMEYLHMQKAIPANVKGVPVSIDAVAPDGSAVHIVTVTSDMSGTFSYLWTPAVTGKYTVTATFMGDDSYGSSWAETAVGVVAAPQASDVMIYTLVGAIAVIIAIAIVAVLLLRKRA
jgi:hypothetical protein